MNRNILVTGAAGFIGASVIKKLILNGDNVIGIDNLNSYYEVALKKYRLKEINELSKNKDCWHFYKASLENYEVLEEIHFKKNCTFRVDLEDISEVSKFWTSP